MKRIISRLYFLAFAVVMILLFVVPAQAATYDYAVEGGNLKFDPATGTITDCDNGVYSAVVPSEIYGVPVTKIKGHAFSGCNKLTSITIPSTVTEIGSYAFIHCKQLTSISIPDGVSFEENSDGWAYTFYNCSKLESITIPVGVKCLPSYFFEKCKNLKNVTLEYGIEEICKYAFRDCTSLESITLPDSVKSIGGSVFSGCSNLSTVTIGSGVKNIDDYAFSGTKNLTSIYFRGNAPAATDKMISKFADGFVIYYPEGASGWTTPTWNGYITRSYVLPGVTPAATETPAASTAPATAETTKVTAVTTNASVVVNGVEVAFDAYNINRNNYFKLRDVAFNLSGSNVQFNVDWDSNLKAIALISGKSYTPVGGEMSGKGATNQVGTLSTSKVYLDGQTVDLTAYTINGNNYFKLRDIAALFDFGVEWDGANQRIVIDTSVPYTDG